MSHPFYLYLYFQENSKHLEVYFTGSQLPGREITVKVHKICTYVLCVCLNQINIHPSILKLTLNQKHQQNFHCLYLQPLPHKYHTKHLYLLEVKLMLVSESNQVANKTHLMMSSSCEAIKSLCDWEAKTLGRKCQVENCFDIKITHK